MLGNQSSVAPACDWAKLRVRILQKKETYGTSKKGLDLCMEKLHATLNFEGIIWFKYPLNPDTQRGVGMFITLTGKVNKNLYPDSQQLQNKIIQELKDHDLLVQKSNQKSVTLEYLRPWQRRCPKSGQNLSQVQAAAAAAVVDNTNTINQIVELFEKLKNDVNMIDQFLKTTLQRNQRAQTQSNAAESSEGGAVDNEAETLAAAAAFSSNCACQEENQNQLDNFDNAN